MSKNGKNQNNGCCQFEFLKCCQNVKKILKQLYEIWKLGKLEEEKFKNLNMKFHKKSNFSSQNNKILFYSSAKLVIAFNLSKLYHNSEWNKFYFWPRQGPTESQTDAIYEKKNLGKNYESDHRPFSEFYVLCA